MTKFKHNDDSVVVIFGSGAGVGTLANELCHGLATVRQAIESGAEPIPGVGGLAWRARIFLPARARVAMRGSVESVARESGAWGWSDALREGLRSWRMDQALRIPARLLRADRELKSRGIPGTAVLESIVEDLTPREGERR